MESPRKKLKLTPQRSSSEDKRVTQGTKFTSTPVQSEKSFSVSVSTIKSNTQNLDVSVLHESGVERDYDEESLRSGSASNFHVESEENYDKYFENLGRIVYVGQIWNFYKPRKTDADDSIYKQILIQPYRTEAIAMDCFLLSEMDTSLAVNIIMKFCLDVAGFRNFDIPKVASIDEYDHKSIISSLEKDEVINKEVFLRDTGRYLLMETNSNLITAFKNGIYNFLHKIVLIGFDRRRLFRSPFFKHFFQFVKCMSQSVVRSVKHTGTILGIKLLTAVVNVFEHIDDYSESESEGRLSRSAMVRENRSDAEICILLFFTIFAKNYQFDDPKLRLMRVEMAQELYFWASKNPKIFFNEYKVEGHLMRLLPDFYKEVRYAALVVCHKLIENQKCFSFLEVHRERIVAEISKRLYDVDPRIAVKAVDFFASLYKRVDIPFDCMKNIVSLVFDKYSIIGEAACRFWKIYLHNRHAEPLEMIRTIAHLTRKGRDCKVELIIEGCLTTFEEAKDWDLYVTFLSRASEDMELKEVVAELFAEAVRQTLTGASSKRTDSSKTYPPVDISYHVRLVKLFPQLKMLIIHFQEHSKILIEIMKIFPLINKTVLDGSCAQACIELYQTVEEIFDHLLDESTAEKTVEVIDYLCQVPAVEARIKKRATLLVKKYSEVLIEFLQQPSQSRWSISALKVSALASKFNITLDITWEDIFGCWSGLDESITAQLVICCKFFLIWRLRNFTDSAQRLKTTELQTISASFLAYCNDFTATCFAMIKNLNGEPLQHQMYDYLTDFLIIYNKELEIPLKYNKQFASFQLVLKEETTQEVLLHYLEAYVIHNTELPLDVRRNRVTRYVDLIHNNILPMEALANVFRYYNIYFDDYGYIIESSMQDLIQSNDENSILMIIVYTMTTVYENMLMKYSDVDVNTEDARNLKGLCVQFMAHKHFKTPRKDFKNLLYFSIKYALKRESNYAFLYFLKHFLKLVPETEDRKQLIEFFKAKLPTGAEKNDTVLFFVDKLKNTAVTKVLGKERASRRTSDSKKARSKSKNPSESTGKKEAKALPFKKKKEAKTKKGAQTKNKNQKAEKKPKLKKTKSGIKTDSNTEGEDVSIHDSSSTDLSGLEEILISD